MIKKIIVSIIMMCVVVLNITSVNAATGSANLVASNTSVKAGETFTVTLSVNCEDGINGIDTTYSYDEDKLELVSANVAGNNWASLGVNGTIQVICNSTEKITSDNVYVLTFKVKDNAQVGSTAKVNTTDIKVDSDITSSSFTENAKTVNINIISENSNNNENQNDNSDVNNNRGNEQSNIPNNDNNDIQSSNTGINNENQTNNDSENQTLSSTNNDNKGQVDSAVNKKSTVVDNSTSSKVLPKTGKSSKILIMSIMFISIISIVLYIRIKKVNK